MPWSLRAQASGSLSPKRRRTQRDRERDAQRATVTERGYGAGWQRVRKQALKRDGFTCQQCGERAVMVHHIDHEPTNNAIENLMSMCRMCHEKHHGRA